MIGLRAHRILGAGWSWFAGCVAMTLLLGCGAHERNGALESGARQVSLAHRAGEGLSLEGFALQPAVRVGDSVLVGYVIRNGGPARRLVLDPRFFEVQLIGPNGAFAPKAAESWTGSTGDESVVVLPHLGIMGRLFALPCGTPGFSSVETCDVSASLAAGDYRVVLTYSPPPPPESSEVAIRLKSDTIRVRVDSF